MNKKRRVVVTGVGIVSPNGIGNENCYRAMINGVSAVRRVTEFDVSIFNTKIAAQVSDFDPVALGLKFCRCDAHGPLCAICLCGGADGFGRFPS